MNNPTDTNQASELFELCKEVYELTGWEAPGTQWSLGTGAMGSDEMCPLYTSDYLLEKLPATVDNTDYNSGGIDRERRVALKLRKWDRGVNGGIVYFAEYHEMYYTPLFNTEADTPLKALLELTIALHEAGVKL